MAMDTGMAGAITAVAATITVGAEGAAIIMVGGTIIIDGDLTQKRPPGWRPRFYLRRGRADAPCL
jgi:hypothetical protein